MLAAPRLRFVQVGLGVCCCLVHILTCQAEAVSMDWVGGGIEKNVL